MGPCAYGRRRRLGSGDAFPIVRASTKSSQFSRHRDSERQEVVVAAEHQPDSPAPTCRAAPVTCGWRTKKLSTHWPVRADRRDARQDRTELYETVAPVHSEDCRSAPGARSETYSWRRGNPGCYDPLAQCFQKTFPFPGASTSGGIRRTLEIACDPV